MDPVWQMRTQLAKKKNLHLTEQRLSVDEVDSVQLQPDPRGMETESEEHFVP